LLGDVDEHLQPLARLDDLLRRDAVPFAQPDPSKVPLVIEEDWEPSLEAPLPTMRCVAVVDKDAQAFRRLGGDFHGQQVVGNGFDRQVLIEAGIERAGAFAAVSSGDNSNIISARVARETFGVEHVVARIYDPKRAEVYERLGIPTVATVPWTTDRLMRTLLPDGVAAAWRDPSGKVAVLQVPVHEGWVGRTVRELQEATGARVAFLMRFGTGVLPEGRVREIWASAGVLRPIRQSDRRCSFVIQSSSPVCGAC
jgi:trk system potassium uptake protein TrkA